MDLDVLLLVVLVQVHDEIADEVKAIAHNNEGKLVGQPGLLQDVLDDLRKLRVWCERLKVWKERNHNSYGYGMKNESIKAI